MTSYSKNLRKARKPFKSYSYSIRYSGAIHVKFDLLAQHGHLNILFDRFGYCLNNCRLFFNDTCAVYNVNRAQCILAYLSESETVYLNVYSATPEHLDKYSIYTFNCTTYHHCTYLTSV
jgi:hypothetical protein